MNKILFAFCLIVVAVSAHAQSEIFATEEQAIHGYDPVAYFKAAKPVKGKPEFSYQWKNNNWLFSSKENMEAFKSDPEKFAPQFGGYCAYGMSRGYKAPTSPDAWTIVDNKLYLNYDVSVRETWSKDRKALIDKATSNWPSVRLKE